MPHTFSGAMRHQVAGPLTSKTAECVCSIANDRMGIQPGGGLFPMNLGVPHTGGSGDGDLVLPSDLCAES